MSSPVFLFRAKRLLLILIFGAAVFFVPQLCGAEEEDDFFFYRRLFLNEDLLARMSKDGRVRTQIKDFGEYYAEGLYDLSSGNPESAIESLEEARRLWPEFYRTDMAIAMAYEDRGEYERAARYYKSYLDKLKDLSRGHYRISAPVIRALTDGKVEPYDYAHSRVERRLDRYGIDLENVQAVRGIPDFLKSILTIFAAVAVFFIIKANLLPRYRRRKRIKNPPEGFWVCPRCLTSNPVLRKECEECSYRREE